MLILCNCKKSFVNLFYFCLFLKGGMLLPLWWKRQDYDLIKRFNLILFTNILSKFEEKIVPSKTNINFSLLCFYFFTEIHF